MNPARLSSLFHSRGAAMIMVVVAALYVWVSSATSSSLPAQGDQGIGLPSPGEWNLMPAAATAINVAFNLAIMVLMLVINRSYNVLRSMTWLPVGLFALMQAAVPRQVVTINSGTLVCLVVALCLYLTFSLYDRPNQVRTVFTTFLLLSLGAAFQYCFIFFIPIFWVICLQMRALTLRSFVGSLLGIITVWMILFGYGIVEPSAVRLPEIVNIFGDIDLKAAVYLLVLTALTAFLLFSSIVANLLKTIAYNARARAYNGALLVISLASVAAVIFDYDNMLAYMALLNFSAAYQITHYFINHRYDRQYIGVISIIAVYVALYLWRLVL